MCKEAKVDDKSERWFGVVITPFQVQKVKK